MNTPKTLTIIEQHQLLNSLIPQSATQCQLRKAVRNYTMVLLMLDAGLRVGEVVRLQGHNLYFNCKPVKSIIIPAEISKNSEEREIPVSERLSNALTTHFDSIKHLNDCSSNYPVFQGSTKYVRLTTRQVERIVRSASMRAIGKPIHPHMLRHTFATKLMKITDMRTVQELLGHKHLTSTQVYTHPSAEDKAQAIRKLNGPAERPL